MNKVAVVLGVAVVATLAGCKDPDAVKAGTGSQSEVKTVPVEDTAVKPTEVKPAEVKPAPVKPSCQCAPGTKHYAPCKCGAPDCMCIVETKPVKPAEPEFTVYYVQGGDYLAKISKKFNVTIASIKKLNGLTADTIRVGQKLKIPGKVEVGTAAAKPAAPVKPVTASKKATAYAGATKEYVVKNGDTLGHIAYSNGINIRQHKELNSLTSDSLKVGQKLKVPAEKVAKPAPVKKTDKPAAPAKVAEKKPEAAPVAPAKVEETPVAAPVEEAPVAAPTEKPADAVQAAPVAETAAPAAPATTTYVVQPNEDIQAVAIRFGITTAEIRELNNLGENDTVKAGQAIKLPADAQQ